MFSFWWWFVLGCILIIAEFSVPGVLICFFGVGAIVTGVVQLLFPTLSFTLLLLFFALISALLLFCCRRFLPRSFSGVKTVDQSDIEGDDIVGAEAVAVVQITPDSPGKVEFRGSLWTARADNKIEAGQRVKIISRKNLTLFVE